MDLSYTGGIINGQAGLICRAEGESHCLPQRTLAELPQEILLNIFKSLPVEALNSISLTSKNFNQLAHDRAIIAPMAALLASESKSKIIPLSESKSKIIPLIEKIKFAIYVGPDLTTLKLTFPADGDKRLALRYFKKVFRACPNIKSFNLNGDPYKLSAILASLPRGLQSLEVPNSSKLTTLDYIPKGLQSLVLHQCRKMSDDALDKFPPGLQSLKIYQYHNITDSTFSRLPRGCNRLRYLTAAR